MEETSHQKQFEQKYSKPIKELSLQRFESSDSPFKNEYLVPQQNFGKLETKLKTLFPKVRDCCSKGEYCRVYTFDSKNRFCDMCSKTEGVKAIYASEGLGTEEFHEAVFYAIEKDLFKITGIASLKQGMQETILTEYLIKFQQDLEKEYRRVFSLPENTHWEEETIDQRGEYTCDKISQLHSLLDLLFGEKYISNICSEHKEKLQEWELPLLVADKFSDEFKENGIELKDQDINMKFREEKIFRLNIDGSHDTDNSMFKNLKGKILKLSHLVNPNFVE